MIQINVRAREFTALARRLQREGRELRSELYRGINRATKHLKEKIRESARSKLPKRGGLNKRVAKTKIVTKRRMSGVRAGVRIVGASGYDIGSINLGHVRHLTYGHLPWSDQAVKPGFWTEPIIADAPVVRKEIDRVMDDITDKIRRG